MRVRLTIEVVVEAASVEAAAAALDDVLEHGSFVGEVAEAIDSTVASGKVVLGVPTVVTAYPEGT